jgi:UDP-3-O-[3-hydroxymyristoyl] glucosamine N-acyltransferase
MADVIPALDAIPEGLFCLTQLVEWMGISYSGPAKNITRLSRDFATAGPDHITFFGDECPRVFEKNAVTLLTNAGACFVKKADAVLLPPCTLALITPRPYRTFIELLRILDARNNGIAVPSISPQATIHPSARVDPTCTIGPNAIIGKDVVIGQHSIIGAHTVLEEGVSIGAHTRIGSHVTIEQATLGDHVCIQSGVRIGQAGFGFVVDDLGFLDIPHQGKVIIGNHVFIGVNTTIARGSFQNTSIGANTHIDALVQIAHNVRIGKNVVIAAQCGIAGSCVLGDGCFLGGQVGIANGISLAPGTKIAAKSGVIRGTEQAENLAGIPAVPIQQWRRQVVLLSKSTQAKK